MPTTLAPGRLLRPLSGLSRAAWPVLDQSIVSLGAFGLTLILARGLDPGEYGRFAILMSALMTLQVVTSSLVFYPMSVRIGVSAAADGATFRSAVLLLLALLVPLLAAVLLGTSLLGAPELALPGACFLLAWQAQETFRRGLFCELRHRDAILGDAVSYLGQAALVAGLWATGRLTVPATLYVMAATSAAAALLQALHLRLPLRGDLALRDTARSFGAIGFWSLGNNMLGALRVLPLIWVLGALSGSGSAASLQALLNVINLVNPFIIGLTNVVPQVAARAGGEDSRAPWRAVLPYLASVVPIVVAFTAVLLLLPGTVLEVVYGRASPYAGLETELRILSAFVVCGYAVEMACAVLHGVGAPRDALLINAAGAASAVLIALPLTLLYGLGGAVTAVMLGALIRLAVAQVLIRRMVTHGARAT